MDTYGFTQNGTEYRVDRQAALFAGRFPEVATLIQALEEENSILRAGIPEAKRRFEEAMQLADERHRRAQALEEENYALKNRVIEAEETAESDRRTSALAFEQVEIIGAENRRLREALRAVVYRNGSAVFNSYKEDTNLAEYAPELLEFLQE